ncbi:unnamed protein product [Didymodactylos carnosus]|uniref:Uncharacterized protein n=1 Tax=Didymodactylos carnosus TaxID=1234261 RepID=A0A8S2EN19_9BILA|nr:unnamed protein product [Didymodactylos carnosus]CAF4001695.1 unnamed protein product [Didymodactylos carnosus]
MWMIFLGFLNERRDRQELILLVHALEHNHTLKQVIMERYEKINWVFWDQDECGIVPYPEDDDETKQRYLIQSNELTTAYAQLIGKNQTIDNLTISSLVTDIGAQVIAENLTKNKTLTSLRVQHQQLTQQGCEYLQRALDMNTQLTELFIVNLPNEIKQTFDEKSNGRNPIAKCTIFRSTYYW